MFRSLHMKLVMIMLILIVSLMAVVGAFLMNNVVGFYIDEFYQQMQDVFGDESFYRDLVAKAAEPDGVVQIQTMLESNSGVLGLNADTRNYYILDGKTGAFLAGSDEEGGAKLDMTLNILTAIGGQEGYKSQVTASYMDVALPISGGGNSYIIYILDNRQTVERLNNQLFFIILEAMLFGLVVSVFLSFLLSKTMITPIERLTDGAERVAAGDLTHKIEVASKDEIGVLTNTFNHMADVLRETLETVENERNKLNTLFLHMTDGVVAFSWEGKVIHVNPAAEEMLGCTIDTDTAYGELFAGLRLFDEVLALEQPSYVDGEMEVGERSLMVLLAPFSGETQGGVLAVIHDVTEQRRTEHLRREFVANVSHELRTPLTNIRSYAETLEDAEDLPQETRHSFLEVILSETDRMTHIVQDLLTLSRIDSGRSELTLSRFPFRAAIGNVYRANLMEAKRHGHAFTAKLPAQLPEVTADRARIEQVMMNIVANAIKYTPDGGTIEITAGEKPDGVWMEVADNGIGIPPKDRARIFERFYRVDKARSRESGGTGLGLSIAQEIVRQHGGTISLVDKDTPGLTVRIELPLGGEVKEQDDA
ncbi:MAG TPA: ATP-binding protein [Oscillospiraceae bacterium]|nr:ATP-binding protein [Oscillospiraceae bacterium]